MVWFAKSMNSDIRSRIYHYQQNELTFKDIACLLLVGDKRSIKLIAFGTFPFTL